MDIDDILRAVDPTQGGIPQATQDLQCLTRAWVAERSAPELLDWPDAPWFDRIMEQISRQISRVEELTADPDSGTNFALVVMQTELERYKFLVRSYLRARLAKLDAHTLHYLQGHSRAVDDGSDSQAVQSSAGGQRKIRLSPHELAYATHRQALLHAHFLSSFLGVFPPQQQHLNDRAGNVNMVDAPDDESAVFVRLLREDARFAVVRGVESDMKDLGGKVGDIFIVRWRDARDLVKSGGAELV